MKAKRPKLDSMGELAHGSGASHTPVAAHLPTRKLSDVLLDFGRPLLDQFTEPPPKLLLEQVMLVVITIWNAHTLALPVWGEPLELEELKNTVYAEGSPPELAEAFELLSARRAELFRDDPRAVGDWAIEVDGAEISLRCDPRIPRTPREPSDGHQRRSAPR